MFTSDEEFQCSLKAAQGDKKAIEKEVRNILDTFSDKPFIFNLGHGILPQTPIENVELILKIIRRQ
jgi:uroporphyrinogen decarboxylase